jgi:hypothetical protein
VTYAEVLDSRPSPQPGRPGVCGSTSMSRLDGKLGRGVLRRSPDVLHEESRAHGRSCDQYRGSRALHGERRDSLERATKSRLHQHAHRGNGALRVVSDHGTNLITCKKTPSRVPLWYRNLHPQLCGKGEDIGRKLLQSVGFASPDDVSIAAAIEANDAFIERLEAIRDSAQGFTIDQDD